MDVLVHLGITKAPAPTPVAAPGPLNRRDVRTQKPVLGSLGVLTIKNLDYPSSGELLKKQDSKHHHVFHFDNDDSLEDYGVEDAKKPKKDVKYATEHILELQTIGAFLHDVSTGQDAKNQAFAQWLTDNWEAKLTDVNVAKRTKPAPDYKLSGKLTYGNLIFNAVGSNTNLQDFVLCQTSINSYKARIWKKVDPTDEDEFIKEVKRSVNGFVPSNVYLTHLKMIFGVFEYMNDDVVTKNLRHAVKNVETEFHNAKDVVDNQPLQDSLGDEWKSFIQNHMDAISKKARDFVTRNIKGVEEKIDAEIKVLQGKLKMLEAHEKKGTTVYKKKQKEEKSKLEAQMAKIKTEIADKEKDAVQLQAKVVAAQGMQRADLKKQLKKEERALLATMWKYGKAERKRALLYSGSVKNVIKGFEDDKKILAGYKK